MSLTMSRTRGKRNPTLLIGAIVFAVATGLFLAVAVAVVIASKSGKPTEAAVGDSSKKYTREEFTKLVMGKTEAEVIKAVGRPESTDEAEPILWRYSNLVLNPATGKYDKASVYFQNGVVFKINW